MSRLTLTALIDHAAPVHVSRLARRPARKDKGESTYMETVRWDGKVRPGGKVRPPHASLTDYPERRVVLHTGGYPEERVMIEFDDADEALETAQDLIAAAMWAKEEQ